MTHSLEASPLPHILLYLSSNSSSSCPPSFFISERIPNILYLIGLQYVVQPINGGVRMITWKEAVYLVYR
jgi:hypothetical protein